jgi:Helix-turn-helix domain
MRGTVGLRNLELSLPPPPQPKQVIGSPIDSELAQVLSNPWRFRIVTELTTRPMSATEFVREVGGELSNISRRFKQLVEWGFLELVEERSGGARRGGVERIYRSVLPARLDAPVWEGLRPEVRDGLSRNVLGLLSHRVNEAARVGTFDRDTDNHLVEVRAVLDRPALQRLGERFEDLMDLIPELEEQAQERAEGGETETAPTTIGLLAFRSPTLPVEPSE